MNIVLSNNLELQLLVSNPKINIGWVKFWLKNNEKSFENKKNVLAWTR